MRSRLLQPVLVSFFFSLASLQTGATDIPTPIGVDIRIVDAEPRVEPNTPTDPNRLAELRADISAAEQTQIQLGAYDPALANLWLDLANQALEMGEKGRLPVYFSGLFTT